MVYVAYVDVRVLCSIKKKQLKKISEITIEKEVRRLRRDSQGNRYYEDLVFEVKYNPTIKEFSKRLITKIIDLIFYGLIAISVYVIIGRYFFDDYEIYSASILLLLIINPLLESKFGKTLGKFILKIQVIDNEGKFPTLLISYKRNFLSLVNIFALLRPVPGKIGFIKNNKHNEMCGTYTILDKSKPEIIKLMSI